MYDNLDRYEHKAHLQVFLQTVKKPTLHLREPGTVQGVEKMYWFEIAIYQ